MKWRAVPKIPAGVPGITTLILNCPPPRLSRPVPEYKVVREVLEELAMSMVVVGTRLKPATVKLMVIVSP
ncbi:hypothetical protein D9M68_958710 [compost metagenome]